MTKLIKPEELPRWVPGDVTIDSGPLDWNGISLRGYRYAPSDVEVPAMQTYMIVVYRDGATPMTRRCGAPWRSEHVAPGSVSLLTHAAPSHWRWSDEIAVSHLYLSPRAVAAVAEDVFGRDVDSVELFDVLKVEDPVLAAIATQLEAEAIQGGLGGTLYTDALRNQLGIHILRNYADVHFKAPFVAGGFTVRQRKAVRDFIEANLDHAFTLAELAEVAELGVFHFGRKFRTEFGCTPHAYLLHRRIETAKRQLTASLLPLKAIAANAGFADQSHMTRLFRRFLGVTPAEFRRATSTRPGDPVKDTI